MKKLMTKLLAVCLVLSLLPITALAATPDYAVTLKASEERIYEGETVDIIFNINTEDFLMTDMSIGYEKDKFTSSDDAASTGIIEFFNPEIKGAGTPDGNGGYDLLTRFTFTAKDVDDTIEVPFTIEAADIVYNYESAKNDEPTNVDDRTDVSVIIVKQYDVSFVDEDGTTILFEQTVDKGLGSEEDTALEVPVISYDGYVASGLVADYYEHVWVLEGVEYTEAEVKEFGKTGSANEIKKDTTFVLDVREQTFSVDVPSDVFDTAATPDKATYGTDYTGIVKPYDDKYDYTVVYTIGGNEEKVECVGDSFTIPGANITGDMTLSIEKKLNIVIKAYQDYVTEHFLITVEGAAAGYTFDGEEMYASENHGGLRAWLYDVNGATMTEEEAEAAVEDLIFTTTKGSPEANASFNINGAGEVDISDAALVHGSYLGAYEVTPEWVKVYLLSDVDGSYRVETDDFDDVVNVYKGRN